MNKSENFGLDVIHPKKGDTILFRYEYGDVSFEQLRQIYNMLKIEFPNNRIIGLPWQISLSCIGRKQLLDYVGFLQNELQLQKTVGG